MRLESTGMLLWLLLFQKTGNTHTPEMVYIRVYYSVTVHSVADSIFMLHFIQFISNLLLMHADGCF